MKRLASFMMDQAPNDDSYAKMYEGAMYDALAVPSGETIYEAVYWYGEIGFRIEKSKKNDPTCPTVTVIVPYEALNSALISEEVDILKRLKYYFLHMQPKDETYKSIYEGKMIAELFTQNGEPMFAIHRRHSAKKTQGCYRELTPTLEYIKKEKAQETKHEKPSIREQLKAAKAQSEKKAPTQEKKPKSKEMEI